MARRAVLLMTNPRLTTGDAAAAQTRPARQPDRSQPGPARHIRDLLFVLIAGLALLTTGVAGYGLAGRGHPTTPTTGSVEAGFARDTPPTTHRPCRCR